MGFFKRVFGRKGGRGTRVGNFIRKWAYENTYGLFGTENGAPPPDAQSNTIEQASSGGGAPPQQMNPFEGL